MGTDPVRSRAVSAARRSVVVVGSVNLDTTLEVEHLPAPGETILAQELRTALGGKGANQAIAAARQGIRTDFVAAVGDDATSRAVMDALAAVGLDLTHVRPLVGAPAGQALIVVDAAGANTIVVAGGANSELSAADVSAAGPAIREAAVVLTQLEIPLAATQRALELGRASGALTILNPAPARQLDPGLLAACDILVPNESEATILSGERDPAAAAEALGRRLPDSTVIVTCGAAGALVRRPGGTPVVVPAPHVVAVDTVAAGDAFCGTLAASLAQGRPLEEAVRRAVAAGSYAVTVRGAVPSLPTTADVDRLLFS
jgi:ribokinase